MNLWPLKLLRVRPHASLVSVYSSHFSFSVTVRLSRGRPPGHEILPTFAQAVAIMNKLAAELDIHKAIDSIRSFILELLACESVTLFLVDSENKSVRQA